VNHFSDLLVDPEAVKQAELMEKRREEERLRIEAMDSKFGFNKKSVGFSPTQDVSLSLLSLLFCLSVGAYIDWGCFWKWCREQGGGSRQRDGTPEQSSLRMTRLFFLFLFLFLSFASSLNC
jgi:hypothetical protein